MVKQIKIKVADLKNKRKPASRFNRWHKTRYARISRTGWRKPRGIDNPMKRKFRGRGKMVQVGFGTDKKLKYRNRQNGRIHFRIRNIKQLESLLMHTKHYDVVIARNCGAKKRKELVTRAAELGLNVLNRTARLNIVEQE